MGWTSEELESIRRRTWAELPDDTATEEAEEE